MDPPDEVIYEWCYKFKGNSARAWFETAGTVREAAKAVKQAAEANRGVLAFSQGLMLALYGPYALRLGYAIECLLKGIWVKNGNRLVENGRLIRIGDHKLGQLAGKVGVTLRVACHAGKRPGTPAAVHAACHERRTFLIWVPFR